MDRIIEPSFDDIEEHLEFIPEASVYTAKTEIGKRTKELFFEHREVTKKMEKISNLVFQILSNQKEEIHNEFQSLIRVTGYSFYIDKYLEFWKEILSIKEFDGTEHL